VSRGKTIAEKILSSKSGVDARAGDVVVCDVDCALGTDGSTPMALDYFEAMGGKLVRHSERIVFALDHYVPPTSAKTQSLHSTMQNFAGRHGIRLHEVGEGIGHQLIVETGRALPGGLVVGADSHAVTYGALNAFATGIGSSDLAAILLTGRIWLRVPESICVTLTGRLGRGVYPKDIALALAAILRADGAQYQALEFAGAGVATLDLEDRLVLANLAVEMGAKCGLFPADGQTTSYLAGRTEARIEPVHADADAAYTRDITIDLDRLAPQVALPHLVDRVVPIGEAAGTRVDMVSLGTCTGGRLKDFHQARDILAAGGGVAPGVRLVVTPASRAVMEAMRADGTLADYIRLGATVVPPGCGACCGTCGVIPRAGETVISTANRNFKGRMGNAEASIILASPASCAAAAVHGVVSDPRGLTP
jgi:3-isopropylmalate/(R)-2-methylmalate dehydratase large subunit